MKFDRKIRAVYILDDKKIIIFSGRKQPNIIKGENKIKLPSWKTWKIVFTTFIVPENKIKRIREIKLTNKSYLQAITHERDGKEEPKVFRVVKLLYD